MATVNVKTPVKIESKRVRKWFANGKEIVAEASPGQFQIPYGSRNRDGLAELHAVLGQVLTDLAEEPSIASTNEV
jgi:hypothetical protein